MKCYLSKLFKKRVKIIEDLDAPEGVAMLFNTKYIHFLDESTRGRKSSVRELERLQQFILDEYDLSPIREAILCDIELRIRELESDE